MTYTTNQDFYLGEAQSKFDDKNIIIIGDMNALNASERDDKAKLDRYGLTDLLGEDSFFATVQELAGGYEQKARYRKWVRCVIHGVDRSSRRHESNADVRNTIPSGHKAR